MPLNNKDSLKNTFSVAISLCLVCAMLVSAAAVGLKSMQDANALEDRQLNILKVCGFEQSDMDAAGGVGELFADRFESQIIDLETGEVATEACQEAVKAAGKQIADIKKEYDPLWCSKSKKPSVADRLSKKMDVAGIKYREKYSQVFTLQTDGKIELYVFPVRGYGLWSMMQGYLAVYPDLKTVRGLTFYAQAETPGLGGEVENPIWKAKWDKKKLFDDDGNVVLTVSKGDQANNEIAVDALSGATITSNGVSSLLEFWMGENGFGPYIAKQKGGSQSTHTVEATDTHKEDSTTSQPPAKSGENHG